eukprot:2491645-Pyramimonas_sp.AAC.1
MNRRSLRHKLKHEMHIWGAPRSEYFDVRSSCAHANVQRDPVGPQRCAPSTPWMCVLVFPHSLCGIMHLLLLMTSRGLMTFNALIERHGPTRLLDRARRHCRLSLLMSDPHANTDDQRDLVGPQRCTPSAPWKCVLVF